MKLDGMAAIVTGGGRGIGRGIVLCLAREGADLAVTDIIGSNADQVAEEVRALGRRAISVEGDMTKNPDIERLVKQTLEAFGKIDILVNNVGGGPLAETYHGRFTELKDEDWDANYEVNLKTQFMVCKHVVPHMMERSQGKIINIASIGGKAGMYLLTPYCAMKGGVIVFSKTLARELAPYNINVNCICPGLIYTPLWERLGSSLAKRFRRYQGMSGREVFLEMVKENTPLGREQTPEDIGNAVAFLASEEARNISGQSLNVDGGQVMD